MHVKKFITQGQKEEINDESQLMSMEKFGIIYPNIILIFRLQLHRFHG